MDIKKKLIKVKLSECNALNKNNSEKKLFTLSVAGDVISKVLKISLQALIARGIGVEAFGIYVLILTFVGVMQGFTIFGMNYAVLKEGRIFFIKKNNDFVLYLASACIVSVTLSICCLLTTNYFFNSVILRVFGESYYHPKVIFIFTLAVLFLSIISITGYALRSINKLSYDILITQVILPFFTLLFVSSFLYFRQDLQSVAYGVLVGSLIAFVLSVFILLFYMTKIFILKVDLEKIFKTIRNQMKFAYPIVLGGLLFILMRSVDKFILSANFTSTDVGLYSAAFNLSLYLYSFVFVFNKIYAPYFSEMFNNKNLTGIEKLFNHTSDLILRLLMPVSAFMIIFASEIIVFVYGGDFDAAAQIMIVLVIGVTISTFEGVSSMALIMLGKQKYEFFNNLAGLCSVIFFGYFLTIYYGVIGMAYAFVISYSIIFFLIYFEIKLGFNISIISIRYLWRIALFSIILIFMFLIKLLEFDFVYMVTCFFILYSIYCYSIVKNMDLKVTS